MNPNDFQCESHYTKTELQRFLNERHYLLDYLERDTRSTLFLRIREQIERFQLYPIRLLRHHTYCSLFSVKF